MHISRIELENIKSHTHAVFEFTRGTTAITGENGAGKTTIIEALAWVLFDLLDYKKEDFVRRGAKKGSVTVTFESGLDGRNYEVFRDTGAGYYVTDPRLNTRLANKKEEVVRFLWQHLGLEPGTDLGSLFKQAIGVPQGTFTAIFLASAVNRKIAFDRLLKVEEYREAAEKLRETSKYLDNSIAMVREQIARAEGELSRVDAIERELQELRDRSSKLAAEAAAIEGEVEKKRGLVAKLDEAERIDNAIAKLKADVKYTLERLENIEKAKLEIDALHPKVEEQATLEAEATALRDTLSASKTVAEQLAKVAERLVRLRETYRFHAERLRFAEEKAKEAGGLAELETRANTLVREIAERRAHLERDERFQNEIKGGFCPILSEKCLNMKPGQTLETFLSSQFTEIRAHIAQLETEQTTLNVDLARTRQSQLAASTLDDLRKRADELKIEGIQIADEERSLKERLTAQEDVTSRLSAVEARLKELGDPRGRTRFLETETALETGLREKTKGTESELKDLEAQKVLADEQLAGYKDARAAAVEREAFHALEKKHVEAKTFLSSTRSREEQLTAELTRFSELRRSLAAEFREKERLETVAETTAFIRDTLKEAAPRVARNYVYHVSIEANQMFREIMGDATRSLKWAEDYSIVLEEDGYERPFISLSGGEQMAAALAVRLGLLKQLSDIRVAFFDEPTANMDVERRDNLAQQISRITNFDQLFVISHDETFDNFVDNVIEVHRSASGA